MLRALYYLLVTYVGVGSAGTPTLVDPAFCECARRDKVGSWLRASVRRKVGACGESCVLLQDRER